MMNPHPLTILALAGRRIDAPDAETVRFPLSQAQAVFQKLKEVFQKEQVWILVSSAACGADLIGLRAAHSMGIRFRILLPSSPIRFRETSVIDRPSDRDWDWGHLYDVMIDTAKNRGDLKILKGTQEGFQGYQAVNQALVEEAIALRGQVREKTSGNVPEHVQALLVWDGLSRGPKDLTDQFAEVARSRNVPILEIFTKPNP